MARHILEWTEHYKTGIPSIDADHRRLFAMINKALFDLQRGRFDDERWLKELNTYAAEHFVHEELLMERYLPNWDQRGAHVREHRQYWQKLVDLEHLPDREVFLRGWWTSHVLVWDKAMGRMLLSVQSKPEA